VTGDPVYRLAIVGWPVEKSLSPLLWKGVGARRDIPIEYRRWPAPPDDPESWERLWVSDLSGFNVTAPYKERAATRCGGLESLAREIGAVNTVLKRNDRWEGFTTDGYGFVRSLEVEGEKLAGRAIVVLGTGGAGRAVARAAGEAGASVTLVSRSPERTPAGCEGCEVRGWDALEEGEPFDIIVNATPGGKDPGSDPSPFPFEAALAHNGLAVDLNYAPPTTGFLIDARRVGARVRNGLGMLVYQACLGAALLVDENPSAATEWESDFRTVAAELLGSVAGPVA
jgi:shikimate dehydrogenase